MAQTGAATSRRFKESLDDVALEPRHFVVMRAVDSISRPSQQLLADRLHIPASSMVGVIDQLEERGLVTRELDLADRRVHVVVLTEEGRALLARAMEVAMGIEMSVCAGLGSDEREALLSLLERVATNLGLSEGIHPDLGASIGQGLAQSPGT